MRPIEKVLKRMEAFLHIVSCTAILAMMLLITLDTAGRYFLNRPIQGTYEITEMYLMVIVVFMALSYSFQTGDHVKIDIWYRHFSVRTKAIVDLFSLILSAGLFAIIAYQGWLVTWEAWKQNEYTFGVIALPMYLSYLWVPLGSGAMTLRLAIDVCKCVRTLSGTSPDVGLEASEEQASVSEASS